MCTNLHIIMLMGVSFHFFDHLFSFGTFCKLKIIHNMINLVNNNVLWHHKYDKNDLPIYHLYISYWCYICNNIINRYIKKTNWLLSSAIHQDIFGDNGPLSQPTYLIPLLVSFCGQNWIIRALSELNDLKATMSAVKNLLLNYPLVMHYINMFYRNLYVSLFAHRNNTNMISSAHSDIIINILMSTLNSLQQGNLCLLKQCVIPVFLPRLQFQIHI